MSDGALIGISGQPGSARPSIGISGQPGSARPSIGIDLGATRIKAGVVADSALVREETVHVGERTPESIIESLAALVERIDPGASHPIGIAAAGVIDQRAGVVRESPNFPGWRDFPLSAELAARTGRVVLLDNDANAVILGEARLGVARGVANVFGYTLGTGVGGGIVIDGQPYRGERGMAAELGHVTVEPNGRPCGCGNHGCLERYAGQTGIITTLAERGGALAALLHPDPSDAPRRLAERADAGRDDDGDRGLELAPSDRRDEGLEVRPATRHEDTEASPGHLELRHK